MPEVFMNAFSLKSHDFKHFLQRFWGVVANAPSPYFRPVQSNVILGGKNILNIFFGQQIWHVFWLWSRKGVVRECPAAILIFLKEWKVYNPAKSKKILVLFIFPYVWPVGSVLCHGLFVRYSGERNLLNLFFMVECLNDLNQKFFIERHHVFLHHKTHFQIQLREFWLAVCPGVFVTKASGNLEISFNPRNLQKLFILLGRLRQCVKSSRCFRD